MARKVDKTANFVFVQEPAIYDKRHADYARRDKIDMAWERITDRMEESGMCVYVYIHVL
jgi:hypothetical protein